MNKNDCLVSVIVPVYNVESFLGKCIDNLLAQSHENIEIILVDDGSKDASGRIADDYSKKDTRIKVAHQNNSGVSSARNLGIGMASGEYICFVDADDTMSEDYVQYLLNLIVDNHADIAMTKDMFNSYRLKQNKDSDKTEVISGYEAAKCFLYYYYPIGVYSKIFTRSLLDNIRFVSELFVGEGFNFNMAALQRADRVCIGYKRVYTYRLDNATSCMTAFNIKKVECGIEALQVIKKNLLFTDRVMLHAWNYANWVTYCSMWIFIKTGKSETLYPELYENYLEIVKRDAHYAFDAPISFSEKIKAFIFMIWPSLYHYLRNGRRIFYSKFLFLAKYSR